MGITLSHQSALDVMRTIRSDGVNIQEVDPIPLVEPSVWAGRRWLPRVFSDSEWKWNKPSRASHLHALVPDHAHRIRFAQVDSHVQPPGMPAGSVLWLDEHSSIVCPELLFLQMAATFSLPALVLLGYELCGHFSRNAHDPVEGDVHIELPQATNVKSLSDYLSSFRRIPGLAKARRALQHITDHAVSAPEALLATMYSLPPKECGYGMGPITLNECVGIADLSGSSTLRNRFPDLMFPFAPIGINYDGNDHLDLDGLVSVSKAAALAEDDERKRVQAALEEKKRQVRKKVVDDTLRNRQLMAQGKLVLPATKEDLYGWGNLDNFTRYLLMCASAFFGTETSEYEKTLDNTDQARDRYDLLTSFLPIGRYKDATYGKL